MVSAEQMVRFVAGQTVRLVAQAAGALRPWSHRSQHDAWLAGYQEGCRDSVRRGG